MNHLHLTIQAERVESHQVHLVEIPRVEEFVSVLVLCERRLVFV